MKGRMIHPSCSHHFALNDFAASPASAKLEQFDTPVKRSGCETRAKKGHGTSLRRHTMTSILKRDDQMVIPPSRSLVPVLSAIA
jgi:hypothetical protein